MLAAAITFRFSDQQLVKRSLPVVELSRHRRTQGRIAPWVHAVRLLLLGLLLVGLHRWGDARAPVPGDGQPLVIDSVIALAHLPMADSVEPWEQDATVLCARDAAGEPLGWVAQTSPHADTIVGYAGPSNVLLVMDSQWTLQNVDLLHCSDTLEHLRKVQSNRAFWNQFIGWKWGETAEVRVDGVSGATLTSLAIGEAIAWRMAAAGGAAASPPPLRRSSRFPDDIAAEELRKWFPTAHVVREDPQAVYRSEVFNADGTRLGEVIRTGPLSDAVIGYQGPTEVFLRIDDAGQVVDLILGKSFDNSRYVNYVKQEASFWRKFKPRSLQSLAELDFDAELIEGVSGATMTSLAVAESIREAAGACLEHRQELADAARRAEQTAGVPNRFLRWNWSVGELCTAALAALVLLWSRSSLRGRRLPRLLWQTTSLVVLVLLSGNLLSVALLGGWARGGVPWRLAPGLTTLVVVAVLAAAVGKSNVYCDHLCPHGILQQWLRPSRSRRLGEPLEWGLRLSAAVILAVTLVWIVVPAGINLAWLEPFDAYVLRVGVSFSLAIWAISLLLARFKPMAYCRLACPSGKLLDFVRRDAASHRIGVVDLALAAAVTVLWLT